MGYNLVHQQCGTITNEVNLLSSLDQHKPNLLGYNLVHQQCGTITNEVNLLSSLDQHKPNFPTVCTS